VQGWGPDFIPKLAEDAAGSYDEVRPIDSAEALHLARELAVKEGIFCGISGGATFAAALSVAREAKAGSVVVCMIPDTGERYLSTLLFDGVPDLHLHHAIERVEHAFSPPGFVLAFFDL
jgi:cysteine synthase A